MNVFVSKNISYCFGVKRAINLVFDIYHKNKDKKIYLFGELIHNSHFVNELKKYSIEVINFNSENAILKLNQFKRGDIVIFSAHGHDEKYEKILKKNGVEFFDAICPIVEMNLKRIKEEKSEIIFIGKKNHPETEASLTYSDHVYLYEINEKFDYSKIKTDAPLVINQTTLSILELQEVFIDIKKNILNPRFCNEICAQARLRQEEVASEGQEIDLFIVIGDKNSSNSRKLFDVAKSIHKEKKVLFVENLDELKKYDLKNYKNAKVFSGTSTPQELIDEIIIYIKGL